MKSAVSYVATTIPVAGSSLLPKSISLLYPGFLRSDDDSRCWIITSSEVNEKKHTANLEIINDYGSEDLTATLSYNPKDSTYTLKQNVGSTIKIARNRKWVKLPGTMQFKRK